jgi:hypothetical protein
MGQVNDFDTDCSTSHLDQNAINLPGVMDCRGSHRDLNDHRRILSLWKTPVPREKMLK